MSESHVYRIKKHAPGVPPDIDSAGLWNDADRLSISCFRPESSNHRPATTVMLKYSNESIYGLFTVQDRFVRCVNRGFGTQVYKDSCVEFFVKPKPDSGYFNFEFNCGGSVLCSYITNPERTAVGFKEFTLLTLEDCSQLKVTHSMPETVEPEITEPVEWRLFFCLPFELLERYVGKLRPLEKTTWRANFNKCGDETSHPHWATWAPVSKLNFHMPECFGRITFE